MEEQAGVAVAAGRPHELVQQAGVRLVVSFPAVALSVPEARALRNGLVVDLGVTLAQAVMSVQVEGEVIGAGRLLLVGPHAGVQLHEVSESEGA